MVTGKAEYGTHAGRWGARGGGSVCGVPMDSFIHSLIFQKQDSKASAEREETKV